MEEVNYMCDTTEMLWWEPGYSAVFSVVPSISPYSCSVVIRGDKIWTYEILRF